MDFQNHLTECCYNFGDYFEKELAIYFIGKFIRYPRYPKYLQFKSGSVDSAGKSENANSRRKGHN